MLLLPVTPFDSSFVLVVVVVVAGIVPAAGDATVAVTGYGSDRRSGQTVG
jgi:hypothetical protein